MKVIACGLEEVIVSMGVKEFSGMTGVVVGDYYGNGGVSYSKVTGMEFNLMAVNNSIYQLKLAHETKEKVKKDLLHLASVIDRTYFPIADFKDTKAIEIKKEST